MPNSSITRAFLLQAHQMAPSRCFAFCVTCQVAVQRGHGSCVCLRMELERKPAVRAAPAHTAHYKWRRPEETILHGLVREHLETFLAEVQARTGTGLPE